jgi:hypothetical protein
MLGTSNRTLNYIEQRCVKVCIIGDLGVAKEPVPTGIYVLHTKNQYLSSIKRDNLLF